MSIPDVERTRSAALIFFYGVAAGVSLVWVVLFSMYGEKLRLCELAEKKCLEQKNELQAKENEALSLRKELEVSSGKVTKGKITRLQALIEQIDNQIALKKEALAREAGPSVLSFQAGPSLKADQPESGSYLRTEKELDSLLSQRDQAQKQMIELNAQ